MKNGTAIVGVGLATFLVLLAVGFAQDAQFQAHMWVLFFVLLGTVAVLLRTTSFKPAAPIDQASYMDGPVRYGSIATMFWG
ncbi:MAG: cytochrome-c oxidase, cbb3-type subunit I, partial [Mesorhizobium sp.]|nr:cytochrome-c oxidase, cbb3-type subunit I [Mesorhizobium sp.]